MEINFMYTVVMFPQNLQFFYLLENIIQILCGYRTPDRPFYNAALIEKNSAFYVV